MLNGLVSSLVTDHPTANLIPIQETVKSLFNINNFMMMTINRCIDYTKASRGLQLEPRLETIHLQKKKILDLPIAVMRDMQSKLTVEQLALPSQICSHIITDRQWLQENIFCLVSNAVKYSVAGGTAVIRILPVNASNALIVGAKFKKSKLESKNMGYWGAGGVGGGGSARGGGLMGGAASNRQQQQLYQQKQQQQQPHADSKKSNSISSSLSARSRKLLESAQVGNSVFFPSIGLRSRRTIRVADYDLAATADFAGGGGGGSGTGSTASSTAGAAAAAAASFRKKEKEKDVEEGGGVTGFSSTHAPVAPAAAPSK